MDKGGRGYIIAGTVEPVLPGIRESHQSGGEDSCSSVGNGSGVVDGVPRELAGLARSIDALQCLGGPGVSDLVHLRGLRRSQGCSEQTKNCQQADGDHGARNDNLQQGEPGLSWCRGRRDCRNSSEIPIGYCTCHVATPPGCTRRQPRMRPLFPNTVIARELLNSPVLAI